MVDVSVTREDQSANFLRFDARDLPEQVKWCMSNIVGPAAANRMDAAQVLGMARQLEQVLTQTYDIKRPDFKARSIIPVDTRIASGTETWTYRSYDKSGTAGIVHNYSSELPDADVKGSETASRLVSLGASFHYSIQDMRAAAFAGQPLDAMKARAARYAVERKLEILAGAGDANTGLVGLTNAPGIVAVTQVSTGTWAAQITANLSNAVQAIIQDINALRSAIFVNTGGVHGSPGSLSLLLPLYEYNLLRVNTRSVTFTDDNILTYIVKMCQLKDADFWNELNFANAGATGGRVMLYERDPEVLSLVISQEFEQFAPQAKNLAFQIPVHMRTGAVQVRYPKAVAYMDGPGSSLSPAA
jgi:hypothetical protein